MLKTVQALIEVDANINFQISTGSGFGIPRNRVGMNALLLAVQNHQIEIVKFLVKTNKCDLNLQNQMGFNCVYV